MHRNDTRDALATRARGGFTLLELLMVILVIGIMSAVAIPATSNILAQTRAARAAGTIASDLQTAFSLAAREREPLVLTVSTATKSYTLANRAGTNFFTRRFNTTSEAANVSTFATTAATRTFFPNGMSDGALSITVSVGSHTRVVSMTRVGLVRVTGS